MTCGLVGAAPGTVTAIKRSGSVLDLISATDKDPPPTTPRERLRAQQERVDLSASRGSETAPAPESDDATSPTKALGVDDLAGPGGATAVGSEAPATGAATARKQAAVAELVLRVPRWRAAARRERETDRDRGCAAE